MSEINAVNPKNPAKIAKNYRISGVHRETPHATMAPSAGETPQRQKAPSEDAETGQTQSGTATPQRGTGATR